MKGFFITGTDTGVGKTYVAVGLANALSRRGINVGVMKPAETGCSRHFGKLIPRDTLKLIKAAGVRDALSLVNPYRFRKPLAPFVAAKFEKAEVDMRTILHAYDILSTRHAAMIVEGAGGIMVPLSRNETYRDLAGAIGLPVIIVARPCLGTVNHTLLTISSLKERSIKISGVIINYSKDWKRGLAEKTSPDLIEKLSDVMIVGTVSHGSKDFDTIAEKIL